MWKWMKRLFRYTLLTLLALVVLGASYQAISTVIDTRRFPPPGQLVDVGGHKLHMLCTGQGSPTLVLEAGLGGSSLDWASVQPKLTPLTRVCVYDRAGYGWSESGPEPRTSEQVVSELHTLLDRAGEKAPFVLVAHSLGGLDAILYADHYRKDIAGMVLVDPTVDDLVPPSARSELDESTVHLLEGKGHEAMASMASFARIVSYSSRVGLPRALTATGLMPDGLGGIQDELPKEVRPQYLAVTERTRALQAWYQESRAIEESQAEVRAVRSLGDLPLIIMRTANDPNADMPPELSPAARQVLARHAEDELYLPLSTRARLVVVDKSGHYIQLDQPEAVIRAVQDVLKMVHR